MITQKNLVEFKVMRLLRNHMDLSADVQDLHCLCWRMIYKRNKFGGRMCIQLKPVKSLKRGLSCAYIFILHSLKRETRRCNTYLSHISLDLSRSKDSSIALLDKIVDTITNCDAWLQALNREDSVSNQCQVDLRRVEELHIAPIWFKWDL